MGNIKTTMTITPEQLIKLRAIAILRCGNRVPKCAVEYFLKIFEDTTSGEEKMKYELMCKADLEILEQKKKNLGLV